MKTTKKYQDGGPTSLFEKRQAKKVAKAKTRAAVAQLEGEGTVSQKRDNRANRVSKALGTARVKSPKTLSTSTSTTTSDNRNSGNTSNTTNSGSSSGSSSGAMGGSGGRSGSSSGVDNSKKSSTSVRQSQDNSRTTNVKNTSNTNVRQSQDNSKNTSVNQSQDNSKFTDKSTTNYTDKSTKSNVNQSRKNTQVGTGNTSTKNSNYKLGGFKKMGMGGMHMMPDSTMMKNTEMKRGGTKKPKMMSGGAKPKAMYGTSMKPTMMKKAGTVTKAQKGKTVKPKALITPFENYMKTPGSVPSDTLQSFEGYRNTDNPTLDKAYFDTYYGGANNERRKGSDTVKYDSSGNRIRQKGGTLTKAQKGTAVKPKAMYGKSVKPGMMRKGGTKKK